MGDLCSVPFNIACGRCRMCKEGHTGVCLNVNPDRPGSAYGYVDMGGWVGGQAEYVHGALRRLEPAQVPRSRPGAGEDPRPDDALGHLPDRLPRRLHRGGRARIDRVRGGRRPGRARGRVLGPPAGRRRRDRRRPDRRAARAGALVRLRDGGHLEGRAEGPDRADPRRARGRRRGRRRRVRGPRPRVRRGAGGAGDGAQQHHGCHPGGRQARASRAST